jgi:hypothetical protein
MLNIFHSVVTMGHTQIVKTSKNTCNQEKYKDKLKQCILNIYLKQMLL